MKKERLTGSLQEPSPSFVSNVSSNTTEGDVIFYAYYFGGLFLLTLVGLVGNILVIRAIWKHEKLRLPSNYFIFSLACSDLGLVVLYPVYNISHIEDNAVQDILGKWWVCMSTLVPILCFLCISAFNLVGITAIRYISIRDPLSFNSRVTHGRAVSACIFVWVFIVTVQGAVYIRLNPNNEFRNICRYEKAMEKWQLAFMTVSDVIIPGCIMLVLYIQIVWIGRRHVRVMANQEYSIHHNTHTLRTTIFQRELRLLRMASILVGYFIFSWTPFTIYTYITMDCDCEVNRFIRATVRLILHSNTAVNILIYTGRLREFREAIKQDLKCIFIQLKQVRLNSVISHGPPTIVTGQRLSVDNPDQQQELAVFNVHQDLPDIDEDNDLESSTDEVKGAKLKQEKHPLAQNSIHCTNITPWYKTSIENSNYSLFKHRDCGRIETSEHDKFGLVNGHVALTGNGDKSENNHRHTVIESKSSIASEESFSWTEKWEDFKWKSADSVLKLECMNTNFPEDSDTSEDLNDY